MKHMINASVLLMLVLGGCASYEEQAAEMTPSERAQECREYQQMLGKAKQERSAIVQAYNACKAEEPKLVRVETKCRGYGGGTISGNSYSGFGGNVNHNGTISTSSNSNCVSTPVYEKSCSESDLKFRFNMKEWAIERYTNAVSAFCS